jgi:thiamine kinase-like enzyme
MAYLRKIHSTPIPKDADIKVFDDFAEGLKLMKIASATKGNLLIEFADEISKAKKLDELLKSDAKRLGYKLVCCHNDVYEPNFLATSNQDLYLIDWEYAGLNYAANDLACIFCRYEYSASDIERFLNVYLQHTPSADEHRFYTAYIALCAFYWMSWGLYKGSVGDDDGFFFLPAYRNFHRFIDNALASYEQK